MPLPHPLGTDEALRIIHAAVGTSKVGWTDHGIESMEVREISFRQVMNVLADGTLKSGPNWSDEHFDWVCTMRRPTCGRTVCVVIGIDANRLEVSVITVY